MLDVARHYFPLATLKAVVDRMALYKLNTLHLHLSDDQGFRLELDKHPELTKAGAFRKESGRAYGGFYTKSQIRELIVYAERHGIIVVPEIDLPGHTRSILAAHPELSCTGEKQEVPATFGIFDDVLCLGNDATLTLVSDILDEVADLFPAPYIHVGGDEVPTRHWSECPKCRSRIEREHLGGVHALQPWFSKVVTAMVRKRNRTPIAWDEVLTPDSDLPKDTIIMAWRSQAEGARAAAAGYPVIMAPNQFTYLNMPQRGQPRMPGQTVEETIPFERVAEFDPSAGASSQRVLGGEIALWTEYVHDLSDIDIQLFPRLPVIADRLWSRQSSSDAVARVKAQLPLLQRLGIGYFVEPPRGLFERTAFLDTASVVLDLPPLHDDARIEVTLDDGAPFVYTGPLPLSTTTRVRAITVTGGGSRSPISEGLFVKDTLRPARSPLEKQTAPTYAYYEGAFEKVPDFDKLPVVRRGQASKLDLTLATRPHDYAMNFAASFIAPKDGIYTFYVRSDDGALLRIDGDLVVDNDARHASRERRGQVALAKGVHTLALGFFQAKGGADLGVEVAGPDLPRQPLGGPLLVAR